MKSFQDSVLANGTLRGSLSLCGMKAGKYAYPWIADPDVSVSRRNALALHEQAEDVRRDRVGARGSARALFGRLAGLEVFRAAAAG